MASTAVHSSLSYRYFASRIGNTRTITLLPSSAKTVTPRIIPPNNSAEISQAIEALAAAFAKVPCTNAFSLESGQPVSGYVDETIRESLSSNGGVLVEAGNASAVALWELPHFHNTGTEIQHEAEKRSVSSTYSTLPVQSIKAEWKALVRDAKQRYIGTNTEDGRIKPHLHLDFLGRNPRVPKVPGAVSAVTVPFLALAEQDNLPVWLEATSPDVVTLYKHFGFRVLEVITVGLGRVDSEGRAKKGGEGVKAWFMMIENHAE